MKTMRNLMVGLVAFATMASGCTKANAAGGKDDSLATATNDPLVVHEWGTFTSFQGSDGAAVEGMQHETEALPSFVHSRLSAEASPLSVYGDTSRDVPVHHCTGKMETPVIYFHSKTARHVKVEVDYLGLLSQWYPDASKATPEFGTANERHDLNAVAKSSLTWELDLTPPSGAAAAVKKKIPAVPAESDWQKAREVDAAYVTTAKGETDQYVFYRGLMRSVPHPRITPASAGSTATNAIKIENSANEPLHAAFMLEMRAGGDGRFITIGAIAGATTHQADIARVTYRPKKDVVADITRAMTDALVAEGLFADEARAMVRTWSEPWFSSNGTRVLYLVPRTTTDVMLPIRISPTPSSLVRVMVGRVEYMTPEKENQVRDDVLAAGVVLTNGGAHGLTPDEQRRYGEALSRIANLGRFAEPATRAVAATSTDPRMRDAASRVLGLFARR